MTTDLTHTLALLDRITDPVPLALDRAQTALYELCDLLGGLTAAKDTNRDGKKEDRLGDVQYLADLAQDAFDDLAELIGEHS